MHQTVDVKIAGAQYPICLGAGLLKDTELWKRLLSNRQAFLLSDSNVAPLWQKCFEEYAAIKDLVSYTMPAGESNKSFEQFSLILDRMITGKRRRNAVFIALGGGVVGDLAGFSAACYQRGIPIIQIPTSLLAMVDSSVGGKTAINHPAGKNMIGAFLQPEAVVIDLATLATLPDREFNSGMAEVIKYAFIHDIAFLPWLEQHAKALITRDPTALQEAIARSCNNKARIVANDPLEKGERALLNLGHTFAHAIETELGYGQWLHGEAVAVGMVLAFHLSERLGRVRTTEWRERLTLLLQSFALPVALPMDVVPQRLMQHMKLDKKNTDAAIRFILPNDEGHSEIADGVQEADVLAVLTVHASF